MSMDQITKLDNNVTIGMNINLNTHSSNAMAINGIQCDDTPQYLQKKQANNIAPTLLIASNDKSSQSTTPAANPNWVLSNAKNN